MIFITEFPTFRISHYRYIVYSLAYEHDNWNSADRRLLIKQYVCSYGININFKLSSRDVVTTRRISTQRYPRAILDEDERLRD